MAKILDPREKESIYDPACGTGGMLLEAISHVREIQMLKLTQTFVLTDGSISRVSEMRRVFEDDRLYEQVFRQSRLRADSREILLCYKVQFRLRKSASEIEQKGQNKFAFIHRSRYLLWALICQGLLNHPHLEDLLDRFGTSMAIPPDEFFSLLSPRGPITPKY